MHSAHRVPRGGLSPMSRNTCVANSLQGFENVAAKVYCTSCHQRNSTSCYRIHWDKVNILEMPSQIQEMDAYAEIRNDGFSPCASASKSLQLQLAPVLLECQCGRGNHIPLVMFVPFSLFLSSSLHTEQRTSRMFYVAVSKHWYMPNFCNWTGLQIWFRLPGNCCMYYSVVCFSSAQEKTRNQCN